MTPAPTSGSSDSPLRIGIPWRTTKEQHQGERKKLNYYFEAVKKAGAEPIDIRLNQPSVELQAQLSELDGFVLPGSPADVDPALYGSPKHHKTNQIDDNRDRTDMAILDHAFKSGKPVLAICFGCQLLNVHQKGTLIQDLGSERPQSVAHGDTDLPPGAIKGRYRAPGRVCKRILAGSAQWISCRQDQQQPPPSHRQTWGRPAGHRSRCRWHH